MRYKLNQLLYDRETGQYGVITAVYEDRKRYQLDILGHGGKVHVMGGPVAEEYIAIHYEPIKFAIQHNSKEKLCQKTQD